MEALKKIMVAVDFSDYSVPQLRYAASLAESVQAELIVIHVINQRDIDAVKAVETTMGADWVDQHVDGMMASRRNQSEQLIQSAHCGHLDVIKMFETGVPSEEILKAIEETGADLLVIGTKGRTRLADALFGSVAERLYRRSPVSVLSVRGQEHADLVCKLAD